MDSAYAGNPYRGSLYLNWARLYVDAKEQEDILEELQLVIARQVQLEQMCSAEVSQAPSRERKNPALGHQLGVKALVRQLTTDLTRPVQNERFRSGRRARPTGGRTQYADTRILGSRAVEMVDTMSHLARITRPVDSG